MSDWYDHAVTFADVYLLPFSLRIVVALLVFFFGRSLARGVLKGFDSLMERGSVDPSLRKFLGDILYAVMLVAVAIAALDMIGVETTAVIAVLGAAGLAIGLALQGSLSNFAAGVMLIILRPYQIGDQVAIGKHVGRVEAIRVFHTVLITDDNREITIPNGQIITAPIENLSVLGRRRIHFVVSVSEVRDLAAVKQLLLDIVHADDRMHASPTVALDIAEVSDTAVKLHLRPWTAIESYTAVVADTLERIHRAMTDAGMKFSVALQTLV